MTLREAVASILAAQAPGPLKLQSLEQAVNKFVSKTPFEGRKETYPEDLERFQDRVTRVFLQKGIEGLSLRDLRRMPEALWVPPKPLDAAEGLLAALIDKIKISKSGSIMRRLLGAYLRDYPIHWPHFSAALRFIRSEMASLHLQRAPLSKAWEAGLFRGKNDVQCAAAIIRQGGGEGLRAIGIAEDLWTSPFGVSLVELAFRKACALTAADNVASENLVAFAAARDGSLRFAALDSRIAMLEALVSPWTRRCIPEDSRRQVLRTIVRLFGDPRVVRARWDNIPSDLKQTVLQWLTRSSIEQFLSVVDHSLRGDDHERGMWRYRKAFWIHCLDIGLIDEAWVVFGRDAKAAARKAGLSGFAAFEGPQDAKKSALIMRMGDVTIAEWSHNGRCWIWPTAGEVARSKGQSSKSSFTQPPALYRSSYETVALTNAPTSTVHRDPQSGAWQDKIAGIIRELTGRKLKRLDYMPKD